MIDTIRERLRGLAGLATRLDEVLAGVAELPPSCHVETAQALVQLVKLAEGLDKVNAKLGALAERLSNPLFDQQPPTTAGNGDPATGPSRKRHRRRP
jgi:hypothetical protein